MAKDENTKESKQEAQIKLAREASKEANELADKAKKKADKLAKKADITPAARNAEKAKREADKLAKKAEKAQDKVKKLTGVKAKVSAAVDSAKGIWEKATKGTLLAEHGKQDGAALKGYQKDLSAANKKLEKLNNLKKPNAKAVKSTEGHIAKIQKNVDKVTDKLLKTRGEKFADLKITDRITASVGGNFGKSVSGLEKGLRGAGAVVGVGAMLSAGKNMISPEKGPDGQSQTSFGKEAAKFTAGAGALYLAAIHGGANRAMGLRI